MQYYDRVMKKKNGIIEKFSKIDVLAHYNSKKRFML